MKRPLFCFCVITIAIITLLNQLGVLSKKNKILSSLPFNNQAITLTATVTKIDSKYYYLGDIYVYDLTSSKATKQSSFQQENFQQEINHKIKLSNVALLLPLSSLDEQGNEICIGNIIYVRGIFQSFNKSSNPGAFNAQEYYYSNNIYGYVKSSDIKILSAKKNILKHTLYTISNKIQNRLYELFDDENASILSGLLVGNKSEIDKDIKDLYQRSGIAHILSISSLHISFLGYGLFMLLQKLRCPRKASAIISSIFLILFGILTGMSISAIRAIGIYLLAMLAILCGRTVDRLTSLSLIALFILVLNPSAITSCSFLLSFGSVLGICCFYPILRPVFTFDFKEANHNSKFTAPTETYETTFIKSLKRKLIDFSKEHLPIAFNKLKDSLLASLSITLTTLPITLYFFYEVPIFSFVLNIFILPFLSVLLVCGYLSLIPGGFLFRKICTLILLFYKDSCSLFDFLPFRSWNPGQPRLACILIYYIIWFLIVCFPYYKNRFMAFVFTIKSKLQQSLTNCSLISYKFTRPQFLGDKIKAFISAYLYPLLSPITFTILSLSVILLLFSRSTISPGSVVFLDVGQGDCIFVYTEDKEFYIVDGGSSSQNEIGKYIIKQAIKYYGLSHIDGIFVTHSDTDHCNGIIELLENRVAWGLKIDALYLSGSQSEEANRISNMNDNGDNRIPENISDNMKSLISNVESGRSKVKIQFINSGFVISNESLGSGFATYSTSPSNNQARPSTTITCLHPAANFPKEDCNASSICLLIRMNCKGGEDISFLLCGDVEGQGESELTKALKDFPPITVLKVSHHGSKYSTSNSFLSVTRPSYAIISAGKNNKYGHPHEDTLNKLSEYDCEYFSTIKYGAIQLQVTKTGLSMQTYGN